MSMIGIMDIMVYLYSVTMHVVIALHDHMSTRFKAFIQKNTIEKYLSLKSQFIVTFLPFFNITDITGNNII